MVAEKFNLGACSQKHMAGYSQIHIAQSDYSEGYYNGFCLVLCLVMAGSECLL